MSEPREMNVQWKKNFQLVAKRRGLEVTVDQAKEDGGNDAGFSPVELLIASLGTCIGYYARVFLKRREIDCKGLNIKLSWEYAKNPRRVSNIKAEISAGAKLDDKQRKGLLKITSGCTIKNTLANSPEISVELAET